MAKSQATQTREELTGLLLAISIVSKRLAENLKKLGAGRENSTVHGHGGMNGQFSVSGEGRFTKGIQEGARHYNPACGLELYR